MRNNLGRIFTHSWLLGIKDLKVFARDRMRLVTFIIMPVFMMVMVGYIFPSETMMKDVPLSIVNLDEGNLSATIVNALSQAEPTSGQKLFKTINLSSQEEAIEKIKRQESNGAIVIPEDFTNSVLQGKETQVTIITDQSNLQVSMMITNVLNSLLTQISEQIAKQKISTVFPQAPDPETLIKPFSIETKGITSDKPNYFQFMAPGLMAMVIMTACMTGLAGSISRERELGTLDGILVAPTSRLAIVIGKSFAQGVRGILQAVITLILSILLFGVVIHGSIWLLILLLILTVFSFVGIGIMISALAREQETAMIIMMTIVFPMLFLSGALFPIQQMPVVMQWISKVMPLTYSVEALRKCIVLGSGISDMVQEILVMLGFGFVFTTVSIPVFSRVITR